MAALMELQFSAAPELAYAVHREYAASCSVGHTPNSNFLRGCQWSPDGACLLTASDDSILRVFDTPLEEFERRQVEAAEQQRQEEGQQQQQPEAEAAPAGQRVPAQPPAGGLQGGDGGDTLAPALRIQEGELLYDWCWYGGMSAADPASCCLAATGRAQPVHLWDALSGDLRCTYRAYNDMDELAPAHSLAFSADAATLYCGFARGTVRAFRVDRPGRDFSTVAAYKKGGEGLPGIVSCLAPNPDRSCMLAAGSYCGSAALLDPRTRETLCLLEGGHAGGLTHLRFSADGNYLYTGARRDSNILCWDVRYSTGVLYSMQRWSGGTNQRMYFDIEPCGRHLATGGEDGVVRLFDLRDGSQAAAFVAAHDTVNGVHFHPFLPLLAAASGQRRFPLAPADGDGASSGTDSDSEPAGSGSGAGSPGHAGGGMRARAAVGQLVSLENALCIWRCAAQPLPALPAVEAAVPAEEKAPSEGQEADVAMQGGGDVAAVGSSDAAEAMQL